MKINIFREDEASDIKLSNKINLLTNYFPNSNKSFKGINTTASSNNTNTNDNKSNNNIFSDDIDDISSNSYKDNTIIKNKTLRSNDDNGKLKPILKQFNKDNTADYLKKTSIKSVAFNNKINK